MRLNTFSGWPVRVVLSPERLDNRPHLWQRQRVASYPIDGVRMSPRSACLK